MMTLQCSQHKESQTQDVLPKHTDFCVIGGGIVGTLTALELACAGQQVVVLERDEIGQQQSGRNLGWIRQQGRARSELPMMVEANALWREMGQRCQDTSLAFSPTGICYFGAGERSKVQYEEFHKDLKDHGVFSELLSNHKISDIQPGNTTEWRLGIRTPSDGRVEPRRATQSIADTARRHGARIFERCLVDSIEPTNSGDTQISTDLGTIHAAKIAITAGMGSSKLCKLLDRELPQMSVESSVVEVRDTASRWSGCASDGSLAFYRSQSGNIGLSLCDRFVHRISTNSFKFAGHYRNVIRQCVPVTKLAPPKTNTHSPEASYDPKSIRRCFKLAQNKKIICSQARVMRAWGGEIDVLPDFLPVIDFVGQARKILVATGFSGHGFGIAPAVARVVCDQLMERPVQHDMSRFRLARFTDSSRLEPGPTF